MATSIHLQHEDNMSGNFPGGHSPGRRGHGSRGGRGGYGKFPKKDTGSGGDAESAQKDPAGGHGGSSSRGHVQTNFPLGPSIHWQDFPRQEELQQKIRELEIAT